MTRGEAERAYVEAIMERGNPRYFIFKGIEPWDDETLEEELEQLGIYVVIEDEE